MKESCGLVCCFDCHMKMTFEERLKVKDAFYRLSPTRKWDIHSLVKETEPAERKQGTRQRSFKILRTSGHVKVCRKMFLDTLCISEAMLRTVTKKKQRGGAAAASPYKHGKHGNQRQISDELKKSVIHHLESMPKVPSHYYRCDGSNVAF